MMQPRRHTIPVRDNPETRTRHELVFYDWGKEDAKTITFCVHGLTRNARDFDFIAEALVETGRRVIALNMAGRGESAWLADPMGYTYTNYVADCLAVMDNFHFRGVEWIGTSMGGIIGMMIAAEQPNRIKKLILNDIGALIESSALQRIYSYVQSMPARFANLREAEDYLKEIFTPFGITDPVMWKKFVLSSVLHNDDGSFSYACDPAIAEPLRVATNGFQNLEDVDLTSIWEKVRVPTLIIRGSESDVLTGATVHHMRTVNPRSQSTVIQGVGHAPALMTMDQVNLVKSWLIEGNVKAKILL